MSWMNDEELLNARPELKQDLIMTMVGMRAVLNLDEDVFLRAMMKRDRLSLSYCKALHKSAVHAYCKRLLDFEEYRRPESLIAVLQYEFQARMLLEKTEVPPLLRWYVEYVQWLISSFAQRWNIELFEDTGLLMGFQHRCEKCKHTFFSEKPLDACKTHTVCEWKPDWNLGWTFYLQNASNFTIDSLASLNFSLCAGRPHLFFQNETQVSFYCEYEECHEEYNGGCAT